MIKSISKKGFRNYLILTLILPSASKIIGSAFCATNCMVPAQPLHDACARVNLILG